MTEWDMEVEVNGLVFKFVWMGEITQCLAVQQLNDILKGVSRSFYLSMRFLPARMRGPVSLGYLLARASDTLADVPGVDPELKLKALEAFRSQNEVGLKRVLSPEYFTAIELEKEVLLLQRVPELWTELHALGSNKCREEVAKVADIITGGQIEDVVRFEVEQREIETSEELLHYCYQVAGCVGEFWSEIGVHTVAGFSLLTLPELRKLGNEFGVGLQLVNIIRDAAKDLDDGRVYVPSMEQLDREKIEPWVDLTRKLMRSGIKYSDSLGSRTQRMATYLPAALAMDTIDSIEQGSIEQWRAGVKVRRRRVYQELLSGWLRPQIR